MPPDPLIQWYRTADLYVHPALLEPFGNVVVEAMAAGLPLVVTDGTGAADCVEKARCGLVVPRGNVQEMASAIQQMLENQALRQEMAARAKTGAAEYDWPLIARRYVAAYEAALGRSTTG
jgi:glycosyltransferase involved in cell wall biosynthesis